MIPGDGEEEYRVNPVPIIWEELSTVIDPDMGLSLTDLGLIYNVDVDEGGVAHITMTLTSIACPVGPQLVENVREAALRARGITGATVEVVWDPPWSPSEMATDDAKLHLGIF